MHSTEWRVQRNFYEILENSSPALAFHQLQLSTHGQDPDGNLSSGICSRGKGRGCRAGFEAVRGRCHMDTSARGRAMTPTPVPWQGQGAGSAMEQLSQEQGVPRAVEKEPEGVN